MKKIANKIIPKLNIQNLLYLYIIICPILDFSSFLFRNALNTSISPSTIIRPIIAITACIYIFVKDKKQRKFIFLAGTTYFIYAIVHLYIFTIVKNSSSYSGIIHELQYLINYTFMVLNLYLYIYIFAKLKNTGKLSKCVLISISIYILSIYIAIVTGTSSHTYMLEKIGYKGWFESGNSLSAILILSMFIILSIFNKKSISKKIKIWTGLIVALVGIFLMVLIGTRVGLYGFILVLGIYGISNLIYNLIHKKRVKQTLIIMAILTIIGIVAIGFLFTVIGSKTLERRQKVEDMANELIDENSKEKVHITGDMVEIKKQIENGTLENGYMSEEQQKALIRLDEIAKKHDLSVEQMRSLQLIFNVELVKNQANPIYILFGNGYVSQYRETILEMEVPALLMNFGLYGFILYLIPFLVVYIWAVYKEIRNIKKIDVEDIMLVAGGGLAFALSFLSGYIFFNASTTMIIIIINTLLVIKVKEK